MRTTPSVLTFNYDKLQWQYLVLEIRARTALDVIASQLSHSSDPDDHFRVKSAPANIRIQTAALAEYRGKQKVLAIVLELKGKEVPDYDEYKRAYAALVPGDGAADGDAVPEHQPGNEPAVTETLGGSSTTDPILGDGRLPGFSTGTSAQPGLRRRGKRATRGA